MNTAYPIEYAYSTADFARQDRGLCNAEDLLDDARARIVDALAQTYDWQRRLALQDQLRTVRHAAEHVKMRRKCLIQWNT